MAQPNPTRGSSWASSPKTDNSEGQRTSSFLRAAASSAPAPKQTVQAVAPQPAANPNPTPLAASTTSAPGPPLKALSSANLNARPSGQNTPTLQKSNSANFVARVSSVKAIPGASSPADSPSPVKTASVSALPVVGSPPKSGDFKMPPPGGILPPEAFKIDNYKPPLGGILPPEAFKLDNYKPPPEGTVLSRNSGIKSPGSFTPTPSPKPGSLMTSSGSQPTTAPASPTSLHLSGSVPVPSAQQGLCSKCATAPGTIFLKGNSFCRPCAMRLRDLLKTQSAAKPLTGSDPPTLERVNSRSGAGLFDGDFSQPLNPTNSPPTALSKDPLMQPLAPVHSSPLPSDPQPHNPSPFSLSASTSDPIYESCGDYYSSPFADSDPALEATPAETKTATEDDCPFSENLYTKLIYSFSYCYKPFSQDVAITQYSPKDIISPFYSNPKFDYERNVAFEKENDVYLHTEWHTVFEPFKDPAQLLRPAVPTRVALPERPSSSSPDAPGRVSRFGGLRSSPSSPNLTTPIHKESPSPSPSPVSRPVVSLLPINTTTPVSSSQLDEQFAFLTDAPIDQELPSLNLNLTRSTSKKKLSEADRGSFLLTRPSQTHLNRNSDPASPRERGSGPNLSRSRVQTVSRDSQVVINPPAAATAGSTTEGTPATNNTDNPALRTSKWKTTRRVGQPDTK